MLELDLSAVLEIQAACYLEVAPESRKSLLSKLTATPSTCFVAVADSLIAGYLIALPWQFDSPPALNSENCVLPQSPDCLYLHDLAVAPAMRKVGAGRALVEMFLRQLQKLKIDRASLIAVQSSAPYWMRYGFQVVTLSAELKEKLASYGSGVQYMLRLGK